MDKPKQGYESKSLLAFKNQKKKKIEESYADKEENTPEDPLLDTEDTTPIDTSFLQKLMEDEDKFKETLVKLNDQGVQDIQNGNYNSGLQLLEKLKRILEHVAENGKPLDRSIIIVCLYNMASAYQSGWVLEKCAEYVDAVVFNLNQSIKQDETLINSCASELNNNQVSTLTSIKIRKQKFLLKVYLQYCAVLSQLSKHEEALDLAHKAQKIMISILSQCSTYCKEAKEFLDRENQSQVTQDSNAGRMSAMSFLGVSFDYYKNFDRGSTFYDEVSFLKQTLDYAIPFLNNFITTIKKFSATKVEDTLKQTRKLLFNWKNNPENTEKYLRKEFGKPNFFKENEDKNRSILGLQSSPDWLQSLNIGSFMHMKPLKYREYAEKKEIVSQLTKDALQEKVILQSLIYFSTATEIRFLKADDESPNNDSQDSKGSESHQMSEAYHLGAIELVCKYISGSCPYLNHLIISYQKHYNQNLETIPEESFYSLTEEILPSTDKLDDSEINLTVSTPALNSDRQKTDRNQKKDRKPRFTPMEPSAPKADQNVLRRGSENAVNNFKKGSGLINRVRSADKDKKESEANKTDTETRKNGMAKNLDQRVKRIPTEEEEARKIYENSLSSTSLTFGNILSKPLSPSIKTTNVAKSPLITSKADQQSTENKLFVKKTHEVPNLYLGKVLKNDKEPQQKGTGWQSDRGSQKYQNQEDSSPRVRLTDARPTHKETAKGNVNFYLYKNFNKFIQNLYVKNGEPIRLKSKLQKTERGINTPTSAQDISASSQRKAVFNRTTGQFRSPKGDISSSRLAQRTEPDEVLIYRKESSGKGQKFSSLSPRNDRDEILEIEDLKHKRPYQIERISNKSNKPSNPKAFQQLDFSKVSSNKGTMKYI